MKHLIKELVLSLFALGQISISQSGCQQSAQEGGKSSALTPVPVITATVTSELVRRPVIGEGLVYPLREETLFFSVAGRLLGIWRQPESLVAQGDTLAMLRSDTATCALIAPFSGRLLQWLCSPGDSLIPGQPALLLAEIEPQALARIKLCEADFHRVSVSDSAVVTLRDSLRLPLCGVVRAKSLSNQLGKLPFVAEILFENPGAVANIGRRVSVKIFTKSEEKVILIPASAVSARQGCFAFVFVADEEGKFALRRRVQLGPTIGNKIVVDEGLHPGERLIIYGHEKLKTGSPIILMREKKF